MSLPNSSSLSANSPVRAGFHAALEQIESYPVQRTWRPAFLTPLSILPPPRRVLPPDLPGRRPTVAPFAAPSLTIAAALQALRTGSLSVAALLEHILAEIDSRRPAPNAFLYVMRPAELKQLVQELDLELHAGICRGTLHGIPIAVNDAFYVAGMPNTAVSPVLDHDVSLSDASSVHLLKAAGAVVVGKTHTHDPGGSGGGSAVAVATGMSLGALATDTHAAVRVQAALCGVVGFKPTFGLVPGDGPIASSWSLDHVAHMAATVEDAALMLDVLDPASHLGYSQGLYKSMQRVRIGVPIAALAGAETGVAAAFRQAVTAMRQAGAEVIEIETPTCADFDLAVGVGLIVSGAEAAAYHTVDGDLHQRHAASAVAQQMDEAALVSAVHYLQAQRAREDLRWRMLRSFDHFDALFMPTTRMTAPKSDETDPDFLVLSQNCILWSVIGFPAISLPCGRTPLALPVGAQLVAAPYEDARLLAIAAALELELSRG